MPLLPSYRGNREYESNLHKFRVAKGYTHKELALRAGLSSFTLIAGLANGTTAPVYLVGPKSGEIKPWVEKILKALDADVEDIFPRYFCIINSPDFTDCQVAEMSVGQETRQSKNPEVILLGKERQRLLLEMLTYLSKRERRVLILHICEGLTFEEIGKLSDVSRACICGIEKKALNRLRGVRNSGITDYL